MSELKLYLLGPPVVKQDAGPVSFDRRKALALLAYLGISQRRERRAQLAALLWPDQDRSRALAGLRRILRSLNEVLAEGHLYADRTTIGINIENTWVDAAEFDSLIERYLDSEADSASADGMPAQFEEAAKLYRGDFLSGFSISGSPEFDDWQRFRSEHYRRQNSRLLEKLIHSLRSQGELEKAIHYAQLHLSQDRLSEEGHRLLMKLYVEAGDRTEALRQFEHCREVLKEELGVEPEEATRQLYQSIRSGHKEPPSPAPRVAERLPIPARPAAASNLPELLTAFIGREIELAAVAERLQDEDCRLLTLVGPGGMGKTRLALESALRARDTFEDGVFFVSLAALDAPSLVAAMAEAVGLSLDAGAESEDQLINALAEKKALLLLDNFEHLTERADLISTLLSRTSHLTALVTSRERLNLRGEWLLEVQGLEVPEPGGSEVDRFSAVELFVQAACRVQKDFAVTSKNRDQIIEICRLLQGMPLGIELAAGWLRILPCHQIAAEIRGNLDFLASSLRDLPERHRSLRAVFLSSLELLSEEEREILVRLSLFKGGFSRKAAQEVAGANLVDLASLLDKSLLSRISPHRYQMHDLIRQFAAELLEELGLQFEQVREKHSRYYLNLLRDKAEHLKGGAQQRDSAQHLRQEIENIRAGWNWAVEKREVEALGGTTEGLHLLFLLISRYQEAEQMLAAALEVLSSEEHPEVWVKVASRLGRFNNRLGRYQEARQLLTISCRLARELKLDEESAFALSALSVISYHVGEYRKSIELVQESIDISRRIDNKFLLASSLIQLGRNQGTIGDFETATDILMESHNLFEALQDESGMARCLNNLGNAAYLSGDSERALRYLTAAQEKMTELGDLRGMAFCLNNLGLIWEELGDHQRAKDVSLQSLSLLKECGYQAGRSSIHRGPAIVLENLGRACFGLGDYETSKAYFLDSLRSAMELKAIPILLAALAGLARHLAREGNIVKAWQMARYILEYPDRPEEAALIARTILADVEGSLSAEEAERAEAEIQTFTPEALAQEVIQEQHPKAADPI